jgi:hypothetical protein
VLTYFSPGGTAILACLAASGGCAGVGDRTAVFERESSLHVAAGLSRRPGIAGTPC